MNLDILLEPIPEPKPTLCKLGKVLEQLEDPYKTALQNLVNLQYADGGMSDEALTERLHQAELPMGSTIVNRHRRLVCSCYKVAR